MSTAGAYFTVVFEGDLRKIRNPFEIESDWGKPLIVSFGDAIEERDRVEEDLEVCRTMYRPPLKQGQP
jgi:hypothetical protein